MQALTDNDPLTSLLRGRFASRNIKSLANMVVALGNITTPNSNKNPTIELRSYKNEQQGISQSSDLEKIKTAIISWLKIPSTRSTQNSNNLLPDNDLPDEIRQNINIESKVIDYKDTESPSSKAWGAARYLVLNDANFNQGATEVDIEEGSVTPEEVILFQNIIDIWISFDTVPKTVSTNKNQVSITDQATQEATALVEKTFKVTNNK
jgi:hypothetical protein